MGFPKKSLAIVDSLIDTQTKKGKEMHLWNCYFKKGIILDRTGDTDKSLWVFLNPYVLENSSGMHFHSQKNPGKFPKRKWRASSRDCHWLKKKVAKLDKERKKMYGGLIDKASIYVTHILHHYIHWIA